MPSKLTFLNLSFYWTWTTYKSNIKKLDYRGAKMFNSYVAVFEVLTLKPGMDCAFNQKHVFTTTTRKLGRLNKLCIEAFGFLLLRDL